MASHNDREPFIWAGCVLGLAALFVIIGLLTPKRAHVHTPHGVPTPSLDGVPATPADANSTQPAT